MVTFSYVSGRGEKLFRRKHMIWISRKGKEQGRGTEAIRWDNCLSKRARGSISADKAKEMES